MDAKLIAALACAAALALGACSGGNPSTPAAPGTTDPETPSDPDPADPGTTDPDPADPGTTDPDPADPPADGMTEAERFDKKLKEAEDDLAAARNGVTAAVAGTGDIAAARKALTDAIAAARALEAPPDDSGRTARAVRLALKADAAEAEDLPRLRAAESSAGAGWAASSLVIERLLGTPEVAAVRNRRRNADGTDKATLLKDADIPAVTYEDGKVVMSPGLASSGDRLRMRGAPVTHTLGSTITGDTRVFLAYGTQPNSDRPNQYLDPAKPTPGVSPVSIANTISANDGGDPKLVAGLTITPGGLVVDLGGKGATGIDLRLSESYDGYGQIWTAGSTTNGYDLKLDFGPPATSPEGDAEHYWTAALMPTTEHLRLYSSTFRDGERIVPLGTYALRLSNHIGRDRNLEDPDDPVASARDDVNHYLSYAAYGHMEFRHPPGQGGNTVMPVQRIFPFHVGYDAFKDEAGMSSTDIADADKITNGKFKGRTTAAQFRQDNYGGIGVGNWPRLTGAHYLRLRGDVTLTATISGTAADNRISGKITNLESFSNSKGEWENYAAISGALTLQATDIDAKGEFRGVVGTASLPLFSEGGYRGNFYGPPARLEAAGIWYLQDGHQGTSAAENLYILGSFGAARVREGGAYGVATGADD